MEMDEPLSPFTARDAIFLHDKKLNEMIDLFHGTQSMVQAFQVKVENLENRINHGLSPTMQAVKDQNIEIEKSLIRLEANFKSSFIESMAAISSLAGQVTRFEEEKKETKDFAKRIIVGVATAAILGVAGTFFTMWSMVNQMKVQVESYRVQQLMHPAGRAK